ncbi:MAG: biotin transporter BioY, partial [Oscillospiraceae bacterium]|nr:biotin transporter BioY [Oscillospiraceae bacterium]
MALCAALLCLSAYIALPVPFSAKPVTLQTMFVTLTALLLTPRQTAVTLGVYIALGAAGLPVFAGGIGGPGALIGPYCGYIWGFPAAGMLISLAKGKKPDPVRYGIVSVCVGVPVIELGGAASLMLIGGMDLRAAMLAGVLPFLAGDIIKCIPAAMLAGS